jgi:hypothetical protein
MASNGSFFNLCALCVSVANILETIVEEKKREIARLPERIIAAGDLRDAMLERGEFEAQVLTYLKITGLRRALLINFNSRLLKDGIKRFVL